MPAKKVSTKVAKKVAVKAPAKPPAKRPSTGKLSKGRPTPDQHLTVAPKDHDPGDS